MTTNTNHHTGCPEDLLPWFVNHTLSPAQLQTVKAHLQHCPRCQQEVAWLKSVRQEIKTMPDPTPGELGLKRLIYRVRHEKTADQHQPRQGAAWWRPAVAIAASLLIVIQAGLLIHAWLGPANIAPLSGQSEEGLILQITFAPTATEKQIRETVQNVGGSFVGGPGALGVYRIRLDIAATDRITTQQTVDRLREKENIVTHVTRE